MKDSVRPPGATALEIVVPVHDERETLERSIRVLRRFLRAHVDESWAITIADNASTDGTAELADRLAADLPGVQALHLAEKGRGRALKRAWLGSSADVVARRSVRPRGTSGWSRCAASTRRARRISSGRSRRWAA